MLTFFSQALNGVVFAQGRRGQFQHQQDHFYGYMYGLFKNLLDGHKESILYIPRKFCCTILAAFHFKEDSKIESIINLKKIYFFTYSLVISCFFSILNHTSVSNIYGVIFNFVCVLCGCYNSVWL
jgi:hypothetical protein